MLTIKIRDRWVPVTTELETAILTHASRNHELGGAKRARSVERETFARAAQQAERDLFDAIADYTASVLQHFIDNPLYDLHVQDESAPGGWREVARGLGWQAVNDALRQRQHNNPIATFRIVTWQQQQVT